MCFVLWTVFGFVCSTATVMKNRNYVLNAENRDTKHVYINQLKKTAPVPKIVYKQF